MRTIHRRQTWALLVLFAGFCISLQGQADGLKVLNSFSYGTAAKKNDVLNTVSVCVDNSLLAAGATEDSPHRGGGRDVLLMKLDAKGRQVFMQTLGTPQDDIGTAVTELPNGQILVGGLTYQCTGKSDESQCQISAWLRCRDAKGNNAWEKEKVLATDSKGKLYLGGLLVDKKARQVAIFGSKKGYFWACTANYSGEKIQDKIFDRGIPELEKLTIEKEVRAVMIDGFYYIFGGGRLSDREDEWMPFVLKMDSELRILKAVVYPDIPAARIGQITDFGEGWLGITGAYWSNTTQNAFFLRIDTDLDKNTQRLIKNTAREDEFAAQMVRVNGPMYYLFGDITAKTTAAKPDFFVTRYQNFDRKADDEKQMRSFSRSLSNKYEERALSVLIKNDNTVWLCGTRDAGSELSSNLDFWFALLDAPAALKNNAAPSDQHSILPLILADALPDRKTPFTLQSGESGSRELVVQNPNTSAVRGWSLKVEHIPGITAPEEVKLGEIPPGATVSVTIPFLADEKQAEGHFELSILLLSPTGETVDRRLLPLHIVEKEQAVIELLSYDWKTVQEGGVPVKGSAATLKATFKNVGSIAAAQYTLQWELPEGIPSAGRRQLELPALPPGKTWETEITLLPPSDLIANQIEVKGIVSRIGAEAETEFSLPLPLKDAPTIADTKSEAPARTGLTLVVNWSSPIDEEITTLQSVYEINALAVSSKPLKIDGFKIILNGDTLHFSGAKMDEKPLKVIKSDINEEYTTYFSKKINLSPGKNVIRIVAGNEYGYKSVKDPMIINYKAVDRGTLYVYSIGVPDPNGLLQYTEKDARDFAALLENNPIFGETNVQVMTGQETTKASDISAIIAQLKKQNNRRQLTEKDAVIFFVSTHGYLDVNGKLRLMGSTYDSDDEKFTTLDFEEDLLANLESLNCKKLILVDACQNRKDIQASGRKSGIDTQYGNAFNNLLNASKGVRSMLSCSPGEFSWEDQKWENGAFTYVLKKVLSNPQLCADLDKNKDRGLSIGEIFPFIQTEVIRLVKDVKGKNITQQPYMPEKWGQDDAPFFAY